MSSTLRFVLGLGIRWGLGAVVLTMVVSPPLESVWRLLHSMNEGTRWTPMPVVATEIWCAVSVSNGIMMLLPSVIGGCALSFITRRRAAGSAGPGIPSWLVGALVGTCVALVGLAAFEGLTNWYSIRHGTIDWPYIALAVLWETVLFGYVGSQMARAHRASVGGGS